MGPNPTEPGQYSGSYTSRCKVILANEIGVMQNVNTIPHRVNAEILKEFYEYLKEIGTSENYQNQNLKKITGFARFLGVEKTGTVLSRDN